MTEAELYQYIQDAYNVLNSYISGQTDNAGMVIETALGFLGQALED